MPVRKWDQEYEDALDSALVLIESPETDVTEEQVRGWDKDDLLFWLESWEDD